MTEFLHGLVSWAAAPYATALLVVVFSLLFQLVGLIPWGSHADADVGHDAPDVGHDGVGHDADADGDADADADGEAGGGFHPLAWLGVGKAPLAVVLQTWFTMFGLVGITATWVASAIFHRLDGWLLVGTIPVALCLGFFFAAMTVRTVARLVPATSGKASGRRDLVGQTGVVISSKITEEFGEVRLQDPAGRTIRLVCYLASGESPIVEGSEVVVTDWDSERDRLFVASVAKMIEGGGKSS